MSIYSEDQKCCGLDEADLYFIYGGLRAARAFVRPYAQCIAGKPLENTFDLQKGVFLSKGISGEKRYDVPTEICVPKLWCLIESDMKISVSEGQFEVEECDHWFIVKYWYSDSGVAHRVEIWCPGMKMPQSRPVVCLVNKNNDKTDLNMIISGTAVFEISSTS